MTCVYLTTTSQVLAQQGYPVIACLAGGGVFFLTCRIHIQKIVYSYQLVHTQQNLNLFWRTNSINLVGFFTLCTFTIVITSGGCCKRMAMVEVPQVYYLYKTVPCSVYASLSYFGMQLQSDVSHEEVFSSHSFIHKHCLKQFLFIHFLDLSILSLFFCIHFGVSPQFTLKSLFFHTVISITFHFS